MRTAILEPSGDPTVAAVTWNCELGGLNNHPAPHIKGTGVKGPFPEKEATTPMVTKWLIGVYSFKFIQIHLYFNLAIATCYISRRVGG